MPVDLPVEGTHFDLAISFSVFTHLSPAAATAALRAVRKVIKPDGVFVCTIRPIEFWHLTGQSFTPAQAKQALHDHNSKGYAFLPAGYSDGSYGDASIDPAFFKSRKPGRSLAMKPVCVTPIRLHWCLNLTV
jgi:SAM-dependent methyltransferase